MRVFHFLNFKIIHVYIYFICWRADCKRPTFVFIAFAIVWPACQQRAIQSDLFLHSGVGQLKKNVKKKDSFSRNLKIQLRVVRPWPLPYFFFHGRIEIRFWRCMTRENIWHGKSLRHLRRLEKMYIYNMFFFYYYLEFGFNCAVRNTFDYSSYFGFWKSLNRSDGCEM